MEVLVDLLGPRRRVEEPRLAGEWFDLMRTEVVNPATSETGLSLKAALISLADLSSS